MNKTKTVKLIGHCGVDSGQIVMGDPCYFDDWKANEFEGNDNSDYPVKPSYEFSYNGACQATLSEKHSGQLGNGTAVVFTTGYGDGVYGVYATYNEDNRIVSVQIVFDDQEIEVDEDEDDEN